MLIAKLSALFSNQHSARLHTPTVLQMESAECGAASLGIVLAYYGRHVSLEELRHTCGVSRDGSRAANLIKAARRYQLIAKGFKKEPAELRALPMPLIVHWNFNHFLVVEGFAPDKVYLNDPAAGPRTVTPAEFDESFTGVALTLEPGPDFRIGGVRPNLLGVLQRRLATSWRALTYVILASLALVIPGLLLPVFTQIFVDNYLVLGLRDWVAPLFLGIVLTAVLRAGLTLLQQHYLLRLETKLALSSSSQFLWHVLHLPLEFYLQRFPGDLSERVTINDRVAQLLSGELATTALNVVMIAFYALVMAQYDWVLTIVGILVVALNFVALRYVSRRRVDASRRLLQERGNLAGTTMSGLQMIETLKATGTEDEFFARWAGYLAKVVNSEQELGLSTQLLTITPPLLSALTTALVLTLGSLRIIQGDLTTGALVAFQSLMFSFTEPVNRLINLGGVLQEAEGDMYRLDDVLNYDKEIASPPMTAAYEEQYRLTGRLELRDVTFGYSRLEAPLIENFNLTLEPGSRVALIGGSGSGKSTIAKLICGLYEPWSGGILLDNQPRTHFPARVLTGSIAMVDQDIFLFDGTVRDNITLWDTTAPMADVIQAARDAAIHDDLAARQGTYDAIVEEGGRNFSGGQRQRLEIARALVNNPTMLILDEATSALDPIVEKQIDDHLRRRGCACLIVAHRLSTIRDCDEIIVMEHGRIVQRGTHEMLRDLDGPYADLIHSEGGTVEKPRAASLLDKLI